MLGRFPKKKSTQDKEPEDVAVLKYRKPKIMLIDLDDETEKKLAKKGYSVTSGSFGKPYKVSKSDSFGPVILNGELPNYSEQEIIIVDLAFSKPLDQPKGKKHKSEGTNDMWAKCNYGRIDRRPWEMYCAQENFDRIITSGGLFVIFAENHITENYHWGHINSYHGFTTKEKCNWDNWGFLGSLKNSNIVIESDAGSEIEVFKNNRFSDVLNKYIKDSIFTCILKRNYNTDSDRWFPLAKNKYGQIVSALIAYKYEEDKHTAVLILPQIKDKAGIIEDLLEDTLQYLAPYLFPYHEGDKWVHSSDYEWPSVIELHNEIVRIKDECDNNIKSFELQIKAKQKENKYLYDLVTETGDNLVQAVIKALDVLGFKGIVDVDEEMKKAGNDASLREDIRIEERSPLLIVDVKGISGHPSDADTTQAHKHMAMCMKALGKTDVSPLTIINHQRHLPPFQRENNVPYRQELLDAALQMDLGLMTTWDLYRLVRSYLRNNWNPEHVKPLFYKPGRISIIPTNYEYVGTTNQIWNQSEAFSINVEESAIKTGDRIGIEGSIEFIDYDISSIQLGDSAVDEAPKGKEAGLKTGSFPKDIKTGYKVYRVTNKD